jgi:hypothetical protein
MGEDDPWLCPACHAKDAALAFINEEFGSQYGLEMAWHQVFPEEEVKPVALGSAIVASGSAADLLLGHDLPSEDEVRSSHASLHTNISRFCGYFSNFPIFHLQEAWTDEVWFCFCGAVVRRTMTTVLG